MNFYKSVDGGNTAKRTWEMGSKNFVQNIKEYPIVKGRFWAYVEGDTASLYRPGIYCSNNNGDSWEQTFSNPFIQLKTVSEKDYGKVQILVILEILYHLGETRNLMLLQCLPIVIRKETN